MSDLAQVSIYLSKEDRDLVEKQMKQTGLNRSALFRAALHRLDDDDSTKRRRLLEIAEELRRLA